VNRPMDSIREYMQSKPALKPIYEAAKHFRDWARQHLQIVCFLIKVVVPIILRTRTRPVLFYRYVGMGDIICTFPAVEQLKKRHPDSEYIYSCHPEFACLPRMAGITSRVESFRLNSIQNYWTFAFEAIYEFIHDDEPGFEVFGKKLNEGSVIEDFGRQHHVVVSDSHPHLQVDSAVLAGVQSILKKKNCPQDSLLVIHCGPSWRVREFPAESWAILIQKLHACGFSNIVQLGTSDHSCLGMVGSMNFPEVTSLVDQLSLEESIALISLGRLFVGIDSGLLHVAASLRVPSVGIFGPTSPQYRFSEKGSCSFVVSDVECQGCHHRLPRLHYESGCPYDIACMRTLPMEKVLEKCLSKLNATKSN